MAKYVSAYEGAKRDKEKKKKYVSAYSEAEKNKYGIPGAVGYIAGRAGTDFLRVGEGVVDAALVPVDLLTGNVDRAKSRFLDSPVDAMRERLDEEYNPGKGMQFVGEIAGGIGQSVGYGLISAIPYAGQPMMYSSIIEQSISSAAEKTGEVGWKEVGYGATAGAVEGLLESKLGAGVNAAKGIGSAILKKTGINVAESAAKAGGKSLLKTLAIDTAKGFAGEFGEEFVSEAVDPKLQNIWGIDKDARFSLKDSFRAGIVGGISGGTISIGPSAINYKSAVSVGRALQESRLDGDLINRAKYTLSALEAAQTRSTGQIKGKPEGDTKETAKEWLSRTSENRKVKRLSKETAQLADKIRRNIQAYENSMKDPAMAQSEPVAALLGELRGNLFLVGYAYEADVIEQVMMEADDKQRQAFVDAINEELAAQGKKHDYTLADFDANKDDIRRGLAGRLMMDELQGNTAEGGTEYGAEATEKPVEHAQAPKDTTAEQVDTQEENAATEDLSGIEEEVWRAVTDETVKGYGTQNEQEVALLRAAVSHGVPEKSIPLMLERFREGTDMTPAEFADAWADGVLFFGRLGLNEATISPKSALSRMSEKARHASIEYGKWLSEEQRSKEQEAAKKKKRPVKEGASKKPKGEVVRHPGINLKAGLDDAQFTAYKAAEIMAPALKADIEIHKGLERNGKQVNGYYDKKTNTIHINIDAVRDGKHIALYTLGHEVAHYIKAWSPKKFYELGDYVMEQLGEGAEKAVRDKLDFMKRNGLVDGLDETEAYDRAYEEVVADGMELVLTDGTVLDALARENKTLWQKIKDRIFEIIEKIKKAYSDLSKTSRTAQILSETMDSLDDIEQLFYEGVTEAGERTRTAEAGVIVDDASGTAMMSVDDIPKTEKEIDDAVNRLVAKLGVDESRARKWVEDEISLATLILRDDMVDYAHRKADRRLTAIVKNSDYKQVTLDFSNICRKRREYTRMMQRIQQAFPNRRFTAEEFATIRKIMVDEGLEVACGLCYVEDRRQNEGYIAETFQRAVEAWRKGNRDTYYDTKNNVESAYNKGQAKAMAMLEGGDYVPTIADLTTVEGMNKLQAEHKDILQAWKAFNNARGMSSARLLTNEAEYQRQILKYNKARVKAINDLGGLRIFSFSDFEEFHLIDIIQAVQDCAAMGIKIQFYTKVPSFALLMADTKAKGNLSLIPKGDLGYEMKNGKRVLVYDPVEGIDFNDPAFKKVARGNPNIGTILVGINDEHIRTAMEDDFIDYIIPFHTGQTEVVRQIKKIGKWQNYKNEQVDKPWDSGSKAKPVNVYTDVIAAAEREGDPIRNERQFVERFLKVCEERGLRPRFSRFLNTNAEGKYVYTKGYYKLLLDFKMFDKDGTYLPQEPVIPEFKKDLLHKLTKKYVAGEKAKTEAESPAFKRALERVEAEVVGDDEGRMYSIDETTDENDNWDRHFEIMTRLGELRRRKEAIEQTDDYKSTAESLIEDVMQANGQDETIRAIERYSEWMTNSEHGKISKEIEDLEKEAKEIYDRKMNRQAKKKEPDAYEAREKAIEHFGYTENFGVAGYILPDGQMLNFSGDKEKGYGIRGQDHRAIGYIFENLKGNEALARFVKDGNIRIIAESPGITISNQTVPSDQQYAKIREFINAVKSGRAFYVDFMDEKGVNAGSVAYEGTVDETEIIYDIKEFFRTGEVRDRNNDILYSIDDTPETPDVSDSAFDEALRRAGLSHLVEDTAEAEDTETAPPPRKAPQERDPEEVRRDRIRAHETLANALMEAAQNEHEYRLVKNYQMKAAELADAEVRKEDLRKKTAEVNREIDTLQSKLKGVDKTKREPWVMTALTDAQKRKGELLDEMDALDEKLRAETDKLLSLASAKQLRKLIRAERSKAAAMERSAERARQREMDSKEWAKETVKKAREESEEKVKKARQEAQDYKAAVYKTSMDKVYKARREATDYKRAVYRTAYAKADEKNQKYRDRLDEMAKQSMERKEITIRMREARRVLGYLNTMLYHPTKQKHVPESLQALVDKALRSADPKQFGINRDHIREMSELAGKIRKLESKAGRTTAEQETLDKMKTKYEKLEADTISVKRQAEALMTAFEQYVTSTTDGVMVDKDMLEGLRQTVTEIEEATLNEMTLKSLQAVEKIYTVIYHQVNTANQAFATEKAANIDEMSTKANTQIKNAKELKFLSPRAGEWAGLAGARSYLWKNMKPLTVFEAIGSDELMSIFKRVLDGEDAWITDILEAKKVLDEAKKEFGYNKWNLKKRREVTTADGSKVSLTLGEMMSLYAYLFREQAEEHLSAGGFVFAPDAKAIEKFKGSKALYETHLNDQTPHRMRPEDIAKMSALLTEEQRAYARAVQEYLTSLGAKGNEVSRKLYGIDLFKETAYFPIKSSQDYIETQTGKSGDPNIKSRGTFKETVPKAGNPIVLQDFMEVVGDHVNTMAIYHAFVLPVEDLTRVWNYTPVNIKRDADGKAILDKNGMPVADDGGKGGYNSLKAEITKKYGKEANNYILQLLRDLNGGARRESAASILDKGLTAFKRSATMLSLSTIVQQPTSILRAMAYVDGKHFKGASFVPWETVKKYAPVAAIKEIGGHDTSTGARTADYINSKEYENQKDKLKAAALGILPESYGGDKQARDEYFGWLTSKADEVSWRYLFGAIVNEQAEKLGKPKDSEEVLKAAGERFAEVVRRTQVYDSTLTRSEYMRSKDGLMKMATAFGAEPTTVVSMAVDAIIKAERGDKTFLRKSAAGIAFSVIANAAVASLIYAMRDDDEDETLPEKYVQSLTSELIEGFNPLEYLPIARDIMSMFKGYEIERSDMALVGNLMEQVELITSSKRSVQDKIFGVTGAVSAFFGLPVTNVYRDLKGLVKTGQSFTNAEEQTGAGLGHAMGDAVRGQFNLFSKLFGAESGNAYELYTAYVRGDTAHYDRVKARYKTPQAAELALRTELRDNDKRISEAAEAKHSGDLAVYESIVDQIESEGIFDRNIVIRAINNEVSELKRAAEKGELVPKDETVPDEEETAESLYTASDLNAALERGDTEDFAAILAALVEDKVSAGKTEAQAKSSVKSSITAYWKKQYLSGYQDTETRKRIIAILTETGLYGSRNDVATVCEGWVKNSK